MSEEPDDDSPKLRRPAGGQAIRRLWPGDSDLFRDHLHRLDPVSRRARFGGAVDASYLDRYAGGALRLDSLIFGCIVDGQLRAAGELRSLDSALPGAAEAAFSVEPAYQNSGVGTALMGRVITAARNRGFRTVYIICLADNLRMRRLAEKHRAELRFEGDSVAGQIRPPWPDPVSLLEEVVRETQGFVTAVLRWPDSGG